MERKKCTIIQAAVLSFACVMLASCFDKSSQTVENRLFRVHRYFFLRDLPVFRDMLSLPPPPESRTTVEGTSHEHPISLLQATSDELPVSYGYSTSRKPITVFLSVSILRKRRNYNKYDASGKVWTTNHLLTHPGNVTRFESWRLSSYPSPQYDARAKWHEGALAGDGVRVELSMRPTIGHRVNCAGCQATQAH